MASTRLEKALDGMNGDRAENLIIALEIETGEPFQIRQLLCGGRRNDRGRTASCEVREGIKSALEA